MNSNTSIGLFEHLIRNGEKEKVNSHSASGGLAGPIFLLFFGGFGSFLIFSDFFFLGMLILAISLTVYSADYQTPRLLHFCYSVLSRNSHITENASMIISANIDADKIERQYYLDPERKIASEMSFSLSNDLIKFLIDESTEDEETLINTFENLIYNDADEAYSYSVSTLETVGNLMPLIGLVGTVVGMIGALGVIRDNPSLDISSIADSVGIAMKTTLYGAVFSVLYKVVSMRFKEKRSALEYDFERFKNHIQLIVKIRSKK